MGGSRWAGLRVGRARKRGLRAGNGGSRPPLSRGGWRGERGEKRADGQGGARRVHSSRPPPPLSLGQALHLGVERQLARRGRLDQALLVHCVARGLQCVGGVRLWVVAVVVMLIFARVSVRSSLRMHQGPRRQSPCPALNPSLSRSRTRRDAVDADVVRRVARGGVPFVCVVVRQTEERLMQGVVGEFRL